MAKQNLWGDLKNLEEVPTPKSLLNQQAQILAELTGHVLIGEVTQEVTPSGTFRFELNIIARRLNNYSRTIVEVEHKIEPYPLNLIDHENGKHHEVDNEELFLEVLKQILSSPRVRRVISSLISQSKA